ncbi:MarR family winged helix-turn-helix transcriptional regulator [Chelativorans alearense]|uniref:MarR family winged helix-turn-helix transcriptional regulator n=1 Tax=Chelativorans alearense TaxID=2681495 RepID=UPI001FE366C8|nr:MarR family winged helix-turn-helix transcriptional regulator [Chelativorans alearense]
MSPRFDPDSFGFLVTDLARLIRAEMDRCIEAAGIGVTPGEARTLVYAARFGEVRQNVLAERMGLEAMTLSAYLDRLEERGLVKRVPDPSDRRAKLVRLTEKADGALEAVRRVGLKVRSRARGNLSEAEWSVLQELLKAVRGNFTGGA